MCRIASALVALTLVFTPTLALACGGGQSCCGSSGTAPALGIGMIVGIGSIALENVLRKRR